MNRRQIVAILFMGPMMLCLVTVLSAESIEFLAKAGHFQEGDLIKIVNERTPCENIKMFNIEGSGKRLGKNRINTYMALTSGNAKKKGLYEIKIKLKPVISIPACMLDPERFSAERKEKTNQADNSLRIPLP